MKYLVIIVFAVILACLAAAFVAMLRPGQPGQARPARMARALAWRVAISILLFLAILLAWWAGWIAPTGIAPGQ